MRTLMMAMLVAPTAMASDIVLDTTGQCPGPVSISASGLTPNGSAFIVAADALGDFQVPVTSCAGTSLGIDAPVYRKRVTADGNGEVSITPGLQSSVCGRHIVVLDAATCDVSPPVTLGGQGDRIVTFQVDMACMSQPFTTVFVTGPWNGWTDSNPLQDRGDGIWQTSVAFPLGTDVEYKYMVDSWASDENLVDDMVAQATCAPITDYFGYANRLLSVDDDKTQLDNYDTCSECSGVADVTFSVDMRCSGQTPGAVGLPGPDVGWDFFARTLTDDDQDGIWTGTFSFPAGSTVEYTIALDGWASQELLADDMAAGAQCAPVTDYASYANRQVVASPGLQVDMTYDSCDACP